MTNQECLDEIATLRAALTAVQGLYSAAAADLAAMQRTTRVVEADREPTTTTTLPPDGSRFGLLEID